MWQSYGKGKDRAQLMALHQENRTGKTDVCEICSETRPIGDFGIHNGRRRNRCNQCRAAGESKKNDVTVPGADRRGLAWTRQEEDFVRCEKKLSDGQIAAHLKRTLQSVRACRQRLGLGRKNAKAVKQVINEFHWVKDSQIKVITIVVTQGRITVFSPLNTAPEQIRLKFRASEVVDDEDYKAWGIGVSAGA